MVKLLDYWAPWCINPQTPVLTRNGYLPASKIHVGQDLLTINPKTKKQAFRKVIKVRTFKDAPSKKIILETGRELIGDINHLVLTLDGFKKLEDLQNGDKVLVNPGNIDSVYQSKDSAIILISTGNKFADQVLNKLNLLPLKMNNARVSVLARLLGFVVTDGYLYEDLKHNICETHFAVGTNQDAQEIKSDLVATGFKSLEIKKQTKNRNILGREFTISCIRCRSFSHALFYLLKALGSPVGRKKNQAYFIPDWIMNAGITIKREYLRGWLGGDGCKIDYRIKHGGISSHDVGFNVNAIEFHKEKELEREGVLYAKQLALLLEQLGVRVNQIESVDDEDGVIISIRLATDYESLFSLATIGYTYSQTKNTYVPSIREFLGYRLNEKKRYTTIKQIVLQQLAMDVSKQVIAQNFQIPIGTIDSWKYNKSVTVTHPPLGGQAKFSDWLTDRQQDGLLWEKVSVIKAMNNCDVVGITVGSPHTIVTNGIISHNCGPCQMMKPVLEELEKELEGKVEFVKINVDENGAEAAKYGVMGIPTFVVLKDGKEVGRKVGMISKAELLKLVAS